MAALADALEFQLSLAGVPLPITLRLSRPLSDCELMAFSRRNRPFRIEQNTKGELEVMAPLYFEDGQRELFAMCRLADWAEQHGGIAFSSNVGVVMHDKSIRSPDASWTSQARWNALSKSEQEGFAPVCPDFLLEVLPKSDSRVKLEAKMEMWIANGARLAWMIDPFAAEILIYRPGQEAERLARPEWVEADAVVVGFRLEMSRLWAK
jgi:Uma2 family endonuclease